MLASGPGPKPTFAKEQCSIAFLAKVHLHCSCHAENRKGGFLEPVSDKITSWVQCMSLVEASLLKLCVSTFRFPSNPLEKVASFSNPRWLVPWVVGKLTWNA